MNRKGGFLLGLLIFVVIITSPILYSLGKEKASPEVNLNTPVIQQLSVKECIESKEYMRENHMQLLLEWRDSAVRDGESVYINSKGKAYEISIQNTCLECHNDTPTSTVINNTNITPPTVNADSNQFCFSCHDYAAVEPNCWSCHSDPRGAQ